MKRRQTPQRKAIRAALEAGGRPMGPEEILAAGRRTVPNLNLATVYRNLSTMGEDGEIQRVEVYGQAPRYELAGLAHHHHFHCEACDRVFDLPGCPKLPAELAPAGFEIRGHEFVLFGVCADCT